MPPFYLRAAALRCLSTSADAPSPSFITGYLISSCGLSPSAAKTAAKSLAGVKSPCKPDAVLAFLRSIGVGEADFQRIVRRYPNVLTADIDKTLRPKIENLQAAGFPAADIADLVVANPSILFLTNAVSRLQFMRDLFPEMPQLLLAVRRNAGMLTAQVETRLLPNIEALKRRGAEEGAVIRRIVGNSRWLTQPPERFVEHLDRVERLGFTPGTSMYLPAVYFLFCSKGVLQSKVDAMAAFGWSELDFFTAFRRMPQFVSNSADTLRAKMHFLVHDVGVDPLLAVHRPRILLCSLEGTLRPRHRAMELLKNKGVAVTRSSSPLALFTMFTARWSLFRERILPHLDAAPELLDIFPAAALRGTSPSPPPPPPP